MASVHSSRDQAPLATIDTNRISSDPNGPRRSNLLDTVTPVSQTGCFEFDRIIKAGYLKKRTGRTKAWKEVYLVLRPSTLSIYKNEKESKLRQQIYLTDLTAIARLTDPKQKHNNLFGLFTPSKNYHLEAPSKLDADEWVNFIRKDARIEEEENELFLASVSPRASSGGFDIEKKDVRGDRLLSSSPEPFPIPTPGFANERRTSNIDSGFSGNEMGSHSDFSDSDGQRVFATPNRRHRQDQAQSASAENDIDRVVWQGWIMLLRSKGGVRQWKNMWGVLRPRNFILYKDESEYIARWILELSRIVDVVEIDPLSKSKKNCLQVITEEKSYRFCTHEEESLVQCMGAFKSLLAKRRGLGAGS